MILGLSREEFIDVNRAFVSTHDLEANLEFINELKDLMPDDVYQYYDEMLRFCLKLNPYLFKLLYCGYNGLEGVSYLDNDEEYERVREGLKIANINLFFGDVDEIAPKLSEKYDIILLSNIADYLYQKKYPFGIEDFKEYLLNFARLLNKDGVLINYIFSLNWRFVINGTNITKEDLADNLHLNRTEPFDNNEGYYLMRK